MNTHEIIEQFLLLIRKRLNVVLLLKLVLITICIASAATAITALGYIFNGYSCPPYVYLIAGAGALVALVISWFIQKTSRRQAGRFADDFFDLKDGLSSYIGFTEHDSHGGFHDLQALQVTSAVNESADKVNSIPYGISRKLAFTAGSMLMLVVLLGFVDDSEQVKQLQFQQEQVLAATVDSNKELLKETKDIIEELEKEHADQETLDQAKLIQKMVEQLKETKDQKEAMKQYAQLEKKLNQMLNSAALKKDEKLLENIADKLKQEQSSRDLGKKLGQKEYQKAAQELRQLKQQPDKKELEDKKRLAKLNIIAQQMQAALSPSQRRSNSEGAQGNSKPGESCADALSEKAYAQSMQNMSMAELVNKLNECVSNCKKSQCKGCCNKLNACLSTMSNKMCRIGSKRCLSKKFASMCNKLGQCQSRCSGSCLKPGAKPGGKKAGSGSVDSRTSAASELFDNGNTVSIQGQKGSGPSQKMTEESDSGSGTASQGRAISEKEYKRQIENFIQREDIPEEVRQGVKNYFEIIHGI